MALIITRECQRVLSFQFVFVEPGTFRDRIRERVFFVQDQRDRGTLVTSLPPRWRQKYDCLM